MKKIFILVMFVFIILFTPLLGRSEPSISNGLEQPMQIKTGYFLAIEIEKELKANLISFHIDPSNGSSFVASTMNLSCTYSESTNTLGVFFADKYSADGFIKVMCDTMNDRIKGILKSFHVSKGSKYLIAAMNMNNYECFIYKNGDLVLDSGAKEYSKAMGN